MQDVYQAHGNTQKLGCTANDIRIANAGNVRNPDGTPRTTCTSGETFDFVADFTVDLTAQTRYDIGLYFATDGDNNKDGALTGTCSANIILPLSQGLGSANFVNLDNPGNTQPPPADQCGDIDAAHDPQIDTVRVNNVLCQDSDGDGLLNLPNCTSWRQPGSNQVCQTSNDAFPGSPSKCNCDITFNIPVRVETAEITVAKDASPLSLPEPGGEFTFSVGVTNISAFTNVILDRICDDRFGTIVKIASAPDCPAGTLGTINSTTCTVPQTLAPAGTYSCQFKANVTGEPQTVTDTVTVFGHNAANNSPLSASDSAQVAIANVPPTATVIKAFDSLQCAIVRYKVDVQNTDTVESLTLSALTDNTFGSLTSVHDDVVATTCVVPQTLTANDGAAGGTDEYTCTFDAKFCATSHTDKVTGTLNDNDGNTIDQQSNEVTVNVSGQQQP
jgi:hypothetical protein